MNELYDEAMRELDLIDAANGIGPLPEIVDVQDGWYYERIVIEPGAFMDATPLFEGSDILAVPTKRELLPKPKPRYRKELRWPS